MSRLLTDVAYLQRGLHVDKDYLKIVNPILRHDQVQEMRKFMHHGYVDCLSHSIQVSYMAYRIGKKFKLDYEALARAGMLHDFYLYDWHIKGDRQGLHGFTHAETALANANHHFNLSDMEQDIIKRHMWPLNIGMPKYKESLVMMLTDRYCTVMESLRIAPLQLKLYR